MRLVFVDFEDSFTNNILSYLALKFELTIINYKELKPSMLHDENVVLGPGPGHPNEYLEYYSHNGVDLKAEVKAARRVLGICLGHQILLSILFNFKIERSQFPMHGQGVTIKDGQKLSGIVDLEGLIDHKLQRYNSLTASLPQEILLHESELEIAFDNNNEVLMTYRPDHILTLQFHPESVGTSCSNSLFHAFEEFFM